MMDWWVKDLYKIISDVAGAAKKQGGRIECSDVALSGWADGIKQLEAENERLKEGISKVVSGIRMNRDDKYTLIMMDELDALKEGG